MRIGWIGVLLWRLHAVQVLLLCAQAAWTCRDWQLIGQKSAVVGRVSVAKTSLDGLNLTVGDPKFAEWEFGPLILYVGIRFEILVFASFLVILPSFERNQFTSTPSLF